MTARLGLLAMCAAALCACETVEFQSPPQWPLRDCDARFVGDWRIVELKSDDPGARQYLRVTAGCADWKTVAREVDEQDRERPDIDDLDSEMSIGFAATERQAFIAALDRPDPNASSSDKPKGYTLIGYEIAEDGSIALRQIDIRTVSHLIVDDRIPGWIEKRDRAKDGSSDVRSSSHWVYVFGTAAEVRAVLDKHDLLQAPWLRLVPADKQDAAEIDRLMALAADGTEKRVDGH